MAVTTVTAVRRADGQTAKRIVVPVGLGQVSASDWESEDQCRGRNLPYRGSNMTPHRKMGYYRMTPTALLNAQRRRFNARNRIASHSIKNKDETPVIG